MALILALGSNLGNRSENLKKALGYLKESFKEVKKSHIYQSNAVDYIHQGPFLNQVVEYKRPSIQAREILQITQEIERKCGRTYTSPKGPRVLDIDIIFFGKEKMTSPNLQIPHPRWNKRAFVYWPLHELPGFKKIKGLFESGPKELPRDIALYKEFPKV